VHNKTTTTTTTTSIGSILLMAMKIREFTDADWPAVWEFIGPVFHDGETYSISTTITEEETRTLWIDLPLQTFVVEDDNQEIIGTYYIKPNQPVGGNGSHVCNCGYIVAPNARGQGVARKLCQHSQELAIQVGFVAMQYNFVVATNVGAIKIWKKENFEIVVTLPLAFKHPKQGYVDAHVMYKVLKDVANTT
jgi:ribosomal protein S18 acetylase RimI-like enzyme